MKVQSRARRDSVMVDRLVEAGEEVTESVAVAPVPDGLGGALSILDSFLKESFGSKE